MTFKITNTEKRFILNRRKNLSLGFSNGNLIDEMKKIASKKRNKKPFLKEAIERLKKGEFKDDIAEWTDDISELAEDILDMVKINSEI
jgi:hypothetical protein